MNVFRRKIKADWIFPREKTGRKIWRVLPAEDVLVVEIRDTEKKSTEFAGVDISSGMLLWRNDQLEEKWWTSLNLIFRDTVLLHQYAKPSMPTSGKIFTLDLHSGKLLWQNQEVSFVNAGGDTIFCLKKSLTSEIVIGMDFRTGEEREVSSSDLPKESYVYLPGLIFPEAIDNQQDYFQDRKNLGNVRRRIPPDSRYLTVLKAGDRNIFGFYAVSEQGEKGVVVYDAHLLVSDLQGRIIFEDTVDRKLNMPLADFHFCLGVKLIYVRNSEEIVAVKLS